MDIATRHGSNVRPPTVASRATTLAASGAEQLTTATLPIRVAVFFGLGRMGTSGFLGGSQGSGVLFALSVEAGSMTVKPEKLFPSSLIFLFDCSTKRSKEPFWVPLTRQLEIVVLCVLFKRMPELDSEMISPLSRHPEHSDSLTPPLSVARRCSVEFANMQSVQLENRMVPGRTNCRGLNVFELTTTRWLCSTVRLFGMGAKKVLPVTVTSWLCRMSTSVLVSLRTLPVMVTELMG